jgi:S-adenosylmethionine:tRNA ribosyltransferase-isomerase
VTVCLECSPRLNFDLPDELVASAPPEAQGLPRDAVRMLVASGRDGLSHARARDLPDVLRPGDLLVLNTSDTLPASVPARTGDGEPVQVHFSTTVPGLRRTPAVALAATSAPWIVELRRPDPRGSIASYADRSGTVVALPGQATLRVVSSHPSGSTHSRLWSAVAHTPVPMGQWLARHGEPIRYRHVTGRWPLSAYRTPYANTPGSAEMPSAGRALTPAVLGRMAPSGVEVATLLLHCGVSSLESNDPPYAEWYSVPDATAHAVRQARAAGRRVIAVGTTVVRALESAAVGFGEVRASSGWTKLVVAPGHRLAAVDGLLTGWHEPEASHLQLLEAVAGRDLLCDSYRAALDAGYRWHEFGDVHLILP